MIRSVEIWRWAQPSTEQANHVLYVFDRVGYRPGSFMGKLIDAMIHADATNLAKLAQGFPGYASAVYGYKNIEGARDALYVLAGITRED